MNDRALTVPTRPTVAPVPTGALPAGEFVIAWGSQAQDGGGSGVFARRYNAAGVPQGGDLLLRAAGYAPRLVQKTLAHLMAAPSTFNLVVSNIPGPREPMYLLGCELEEAYPVVPIADRHALSIGMTTIKDEACFGIYADCEALPDADLLADCIEASVDELLAMLRALSPAPRLIRLHAYYHAPSPMASIPLAQVLMAVVLVQKGDGAAGTEMELDLP